jgi:hypothetical protein
MEFVRFVWISEQTENYALHNIKRLVFITEVESVYCAVRKEFLFNTDKLRLEKVNIRLCNMIINSLFRTDLSLGENMR